VGVIQQRTQRGSVMYKSQLEKQVKQQAQIIQDLQKSSDYATKRFRSINAAIVEIHKQKEIEIAKRDYLIEYLTALLDGAK
jgi:hypothetical protein